MDFDLNILDTVYFGNGLVPPAFGDSITKFGPIVPAPMAVMMKESEFSDAGQIYAFQLLNSAVTNLNLQVNRVTWEKEKLPL